MQIHSKCKIPKLRRNSQNFILKHISKITHICADFNRNWPIFEQKTNFDLNRNLSAKKRFKNNPFLDGFDRIWPNLDRILPIFEQANLFLTEIEIDQF